MTTRCSSKSRTSRAILAVVLGAVMVIGCAGLGARAADDDEEDLLPDAKAFRSVLRALGLRKDGDGIDYRERPPLVLPPGRNLPPPEANKAASSQANWPVDPDVTRAKKRKAERKASNPEPEDAGRPLTPSQYSLPGGASRTSRPRGGETSAESRENPMSPYELGSRSIFSSWFGSGKEEYSTFTREPARDRLVEPPAGYRTPSANQPYGLGHRTWTGTTVDRLEPVK